MVSVWEDLGELDTTQPSAQIITLFSNVILKIHAPKFFRQPSPLLLFYEIENSHLSK